MNFIKEIETQFRRVGMEPYYCPGFVDCSGSEDLIIEDWSGDEADSDSDDCVILEKDVETNTREQEKVVDIPCLDNFNPKNEQFPSSILTQIDDDDDGRKNTSEVNADADDEDSSDTNLGNRNTVLFCGKMAAQQRYRGAVQAGKNVVTFQSVTEDTLKVFGDIISTGIAAGIMEKNLSKVEDVFNMLGVVGALVSSLSEEIDVSNVFDSNEKVFTNNIKMEALINEDSFDDKDEDRTENNKSVEHINFDPNPSQKKGAKLDYFRSLIKAVRISRGDFPIRINKKESTTPGDQLGKLLERAIKKKVLM